MYTEDCLNRALLAAVRNNNHVIVGKLVLVGARNMEEALTVAREEHKHHSRGMLLLGKAAQENDIALLRKLFGEPSTEVGSEELYDDSGFKEVQGIVSRGEVMTIVPMEIARKSGNAGLREELLVHTDVNKKEGAVKWHGLRLLSIEPTVMQRIPWVKKLKLSRNALQSLPATIGVYLTKVRNCSAHLSFHSPYCKGQANSLHLTYEGQL